jgi:hypothetical protein
MLTRSFRRPQRCHSTPVRDSICRSRLPRARDSARARSQDVRTSVRLTFLLTLTWTSSTSLTQSLSALQHQTTPSNPRRYQLPLIPPEVVSYVDSGRNPDIYTREFVELVQKGNKTMKAKSEAFSSFRDVLAEEMASAMPEIKGEIEKVMKSTQVKENSSQGRS